MNKRTPVTGGLQVPPNIGVSESAQREIHKTWDTIGDVEADLAMSGFMPMQTPEFECPQVTEAALTTENSQEYTQTYARQLAWFNYSSQVLARVTAHLLQYENEMDTIEARIHVDRRARAKAAGEKPPSGDTLKQEVLMDPRHDELRRQAQVLKQKKIELQAFVDGIERGLKVISRQVEIRKMEIEQGRVNIPGRGYGVRTP